MSYLKKHWFIISIILFSIIRFLISFSLPSFFINTMRYDDALMINQMGSILNGSYLGTYSKLTLIKGPVFPFVIAFCNYIKAPYSLVFTIMYILACLLFTNSLKKIIPNKKILIVIYLILIFNPITYSSDLFQRLYRNSLSITELILFLSIFVNIICCDKEKLLDYIFLGIISSIMYLTREDNIWIVIIILGLFIYKVLKNKNIKQILLCLTPLIVLYSCLNMVSLINYKYYNIYSYNELKKSNFKDAYIKMLQIKDDEHIDFVAIPKSTLYKLSAKSKVFNLSINEIDKLYAAYADSNGQINNGNIVWYIRDWIDRANNFKNGKEANDYYLRLSSELDELFAKGVFEKEFIIPSVFINTPSFTELKTIPGNLLNCLWYTSSYKNIKTLSYDGVKEIKASYSNDNKAYYFYYENYHDTQNIPPSNPWHIELIRILYMCFTLVCSLIAIFIYCKNIKKYDKLSVIIHTILLIYIIIVGGVTYTHSTAFHSIRYCYLGNVYILQSLFILLNLYRNKIIFLNEPKLKTKKTKKCKV